MGDRRTDILITARGGTLVIEGKPWADDPPKQVRIACPSSATTGS